MKKDWLGGAKLADIIDDVRTQISDSGKLYTDTFLISAINSAIKYISVNQYARRLFKYKLQTELATLNKDGKPAARWTLNIPGRYAGKERMNFITQTGCYEDITPCYKTPQEFFKCYKFPEMECPGDPCAYTMEHIGDSTTLIFDRPPKNIVAIDSVIYIVPRRVTDEDETIPLGDSYSESLVELVKIIINKEQTSFDQARMRYEDWDVHMENIVQAMALQAMNDEPIFVKGGLS